MNGVDRRDRTRITIERLDAVYLIPRGHPAPAELQARMDSLISRQLADSCRQILVNTFDPDDPSVWFIRQLEVGVTLDAGAVEDEKVTQAWGAQISKKIVETFARGPDDESIVHFSDRAAYLAQFVADLARGQAWSKWYYEDSLRSLPSGQGIAQAFIREAEFIPETLARLAANGSLENVLGALSDHDARLVFEACFKSSESSSIQVRRQTIEAVLAVWSTAVPQSTAANGPATRNAIRLITSVCKSRPDLSLDGELRAAIDSLLAFSQLLSHIADPEALALRLAAGDLQGAAEVARASGAGQYTDCLQCMEQAAGNNVIWMGKLVATVAPRISGLIDTTATAAGRSFASHFGGIFLLLPSFIDQGLEEVIAAARYPDLPEASTASVLRSIVLMKLFGADRAINTVDDPALLLAAGLKKPLSKESLKSFCELASREMNQICMHRLMELSWQRGYVSGRYLSLEAVTLGDLRKVLLLRNLENDVWLWAMPWQDDVATTRWWVRQALAGVQQTIEEVKGFLLLSPQLSGLMDPATLAEWNGPIAWLEPSQHGGLNPIHLNAGSTEWTAESETQFRDEFQKLLDAFRSAKSPNSELEYLSLSTPGKSPMPILPNAEFDVAWSLAARTVMRAFARRLMGFGRSGAPYLRDNFLSGMSSVHIHADAIAVELPSCPLSMVLGMAGVNGQTYSVPWLDDIRVILSLPSN